MTTATAPVTSAPPALSVRRILVAGAAAGAAGSTAQVGVLLGLGESAIGDAIALEDEGHHGEAAVAEPHHDELYSRPVQVVGGVVGLVLVGLLLGLIFGWVFGLVRHRLPGAADWVRARWLGLLGFAVVVLAPALKYPPNPPGVGDPDTVGLRTASFLAVLGIAGLSTVLAVRAAPWLRARLGVAWSGPVAVLAVVAVLGVAYLVLPAAPGAGETPADLLWRFRSASLAGQVACWSTMAVVFGALLGRRARA